MSNYCYYSEYKKKQFIYSISFFDLHCVSVKEDIECLLMLFSVNKTNDRESLCFIMSSISQWIPNALSLPKPDENLDWKFTFLAKAVNSSGVGDTV